MPTKQLETIPENRVLPQPIARPQRAPDQSHGLAEVPAPPRRITAAVDTTGIYVTQAGIARHVHGLLRGLGRVALGDVSWFPLGWEVENFGYRQPWRAMRTVYREFIWAKLLAPRVISAAAAELLHSTSSLCIRVPRGVRHVVTLHDMSVSRHPERFRPWQIKSWKARQSVITSADRVITISKFTADEAMTLLGLPASKIDVVHNGCDFHPDEFGGQGPTPDMRPPQLLDGQSLPRDFFLFVGSLEPGKNLKLLKQAYILAESQGRPLPPLMILGARWQGVATEGAQPRDWIYLGRQEDQVLVWLYRRAMALLFPSIYEGFGLPIVEAMALSCPVVCSPTSALPEVAGDAAMMVDLDPAAYLNAMQLLAGPGGQTRRETLIDAGRRRSLAFSWNRCASETLDVYRALLRPQSAPAAAEQFRRSAA